MTLWLSINYMDLVEKERNGRTQRRGAKIKEIGFSTTCCFRTMWCWWFREPNSSRAQLQSLEEYARELEICNVLMDGKKGVVPQMVV